MSTRCVYLIICDARGGCGASHVGTETVTATRVEAAEDGWTHRLVPRRRGGPARAVDMCPAHEGAEAEPENA